MSSNIQQFHDQLKNLFSIIKVKDVMMKPAATININEDLSKVEQIFITHRTSHVCVVDDGKKVVGVITQKYLYKACSPRKRMPQEVINYDDKIILDGDGVYEKNTLDRYFIKDLMDPNFSTISCEEPLTKAIREIARMNLGGLPVVDQDHRLCGFLRENHIIKYIDKILTQAGR